MKQFEISKKEYIGKLKTELNTVEARFLKVINENNMVGEDFRSTAFINFHRNVALKLKLKETEDRMDELQKQNDFFTEENIRVMKLFTWQAMEVEDKHSHIVRCEENLQRLKFDKNGLREKVNDLEKKISKEKAAVKRFQEEVSKLNDQVENLTEENEYLTSQT